MAALLVLVSLSFGLNLALVAHHLGWLRRPVRPEVEFGPREMAEVLRAATMNATRDASDLAVSMVDRVGESLAKAVRESIAVPQSTAPRFELDPSTNEVLLVDGTTKVPWFQRGEGWDPTDELEPDPSSHDAAARATLVDSVDEVLAEIRSMPQTPTGSGMPSFGGELA